VFDDIKTMLRPLKVYLFGKGILTLAVFAAAAVGAMTGFGVLIPAFVIASGGIALTVASRFYKQSLYEDDMVNLYRNNIAEQLGKQPDDVTRADLNEAAQGNDVIAQALKRQHQRTWLAIGTAVLSGVVSLGLIAGFGMGSILHDMAGKTFLGVMKPIASFIGIGTVSGITGLLLKDGLGNAIGYGTGIGKAAAHDLIVKLDHNVARGIPIAREDVYAIIVTANPALDKSIAENYGRHYTQMSHAQQGHVLHETGLADAMDKLAIAINDHKVHAGTLAYAANDPRLNALPVVKTDEPQHDHTPGRFTERLGLAARSTAMSHSERVMQERSAPAQGYSSAIL
jgi:hypothetical protein